MNVVRVAPLIQLLITVSLLRHFTFDAEVTDSENKLNPLDRIQDDPKN